MSIFGGATKITSAGDVTIGAGRRITEISSNIAMGYNTIFNNNKYYYKTKLGRGIEPNILIDNFIQIYPIFKNRIGGGVILKTLKYDEESEESSEEEEIEEYGLCSNVKTKNVNISTWIPKIDKEIKDMKEEIKEMKDMVSEMKNKFEETMATIRLMPIFGEEYENIKENFEENSKNLKVK